MKLLYYILAVLCLVAPVSAQTTNLVATNLKNGKLPLTGYLVLTPVLNGVPTAYSENGGALVLPTPQVYPVTNGVLNQPVDDVAYASPKICFSAELELANGSPVYHLGIVCPTGTTYSLDGFSGSGTAPVPPPIVQFVPADASGDCGSVAALGYDTAHDLFGCGTDHAWFQFPTGGGSGTLPAASGDLSGTWPTITVVKVNGQTPGNIITHAASDFDVAGSAASAQTNAVAAAKSYSDSLAPNYDIAGAAASAETASKTYTDTSIAGLDLGTASQKAVSFFDPAGAAATSQTNAEAYTDSKASNYDASGAAAAAQSAAEAASDPAGSASSAEAAAKSYADSLSSNYDPAGAASSAIAALPAVAKSGSYSDLTSKPTLGTAAAHAATDFDNAGSASAAQAAAQSYTDAHAIAPSPGITPATGGPLTSTVTGGVQNLHKISALYIFGDSFARGIGVYDYAQSFAGLLKNDVPAHVYNYSVGSTVTAQYMLQALNNFDPNPQFTTVSLISGIENDALSGGTGPALTHYNLTESALLGWLTIPMSNRTWISSCTKSGSVFAYSGSSSIYVPTFSWMAPLPSLTAAMEPTTAGSTETCTITTPTTVTKIGINYAVVVGSTTTFSATIDGVAVTDVNSGTTNFSDGPAVTPQNGQQVVLYRQEYSVTPATSHTIVLTYNGGGSGNQALWQSIDWAVPNSPSNNVVFQLATNPAWNNYAINNTAEQGVINQFRADGLPVTYVDTVNGITVGGQTYAVNGTTDVSTTATTSCTASNNSKHPNSCGQEHYREAIQAAEYTAQAPDGSTGFVFSSPNIVSNNLVGDNAVMDGPVMVKTQATALTSAASIVLTNGNPFGGIHVSGGTIITSITPPPVCLGDLYTDCYVTLIFDTAGGGVGTGGNPYPIKEAQTATQAGTAMTLMFDSISSAWFPVADAAGAATAAVNTVKPIYTANGVALPTSSIAANTCTAVTGSPFTATGVATTNVASFGWASDPTAVTGYGSTGGLSVRVFPGSGTVSVAVCNPNSTAITPGAMSINVRVNP